jgi:hypothetical protein
VLELVEFCFLPSYSDYGRPRVLSSDLGTSLNQDLGSVSSASVLTYPDVCSLFRLSCEGFEKQWS